MFFISLNLNLALYPHDEKGFGCIGLNDDTKNGLNFLEFCKREKNAKVVLKEAKRQNLACKDGADMLLYQAVLALNLFYNGSLDEKKIEISMRETLSL